MGIDCFRKDITNWHFCVHIPRYTVLCHVLHGLQQCIDVLVQYRSKSNVKEVKIDGLRDAFLRWE